MSTTPEIGLSVEILDYGNGGSWQDVTASVKSVATNGNGMAWPQSPSPAAGTCTIVLDNPDGYYDNGENIMRQGNVVRVRVKGECGKCLRTTHSGTSATASYFYQSISGEVEPGSAVVLSWQARACWDSKWNTDTVAAYTGGVEDESATYSYTNKWATYSLSFTSIGGTGIQARFAPDLTRDSPYQQIEYRNMSLTIDGGANLFTNPTFTSGTTGWTAYNAGAGTLAISVVDDNNPIWYGFIEDTHPTPPHFKVADYTTTVQCTDLVTRLQTGRMNAPLQRDKTCDQLITTALDYVGSNPSASFRAWYRENGARRIYLLNEAVGSTSAVDSGSDGIDSTVGFTTATFGDDALLENGDPATSALFNGSTTEIRADALDLINKSWSMMGMCKLLAGATDQVLISLYNADDNESSEVFVSFTLGTTGNVNFFHKSVDVFNGSSDGFNYTVPQHVAVTYDYGAQLLTVYLNGASEGTATSVSALTKETQIFIGFSFDNANYASGNIANVMVWDTCLSAAEVTAAYEVTQFSASKQRRWFPGIHLETCSQVFSVAFDGYRENRVTPFAAIEDAVNSEAGRWYVDPAGTLTARNRDWWLLWRYRYYDPGYLPGYNTVLLGATDHYTIDNISTAGERVINSVSVQYTPRTISTGAAGVLGTATGTVPPKVSGVLADGTAVPGEETITIYFKNDSGNPIAGYDFVTPLVPWHSLTPSATYDVRVWGDDSDMESDGATDYTPGGDDPLNRGKYCEYQIVSKSPSQAKFKFKNFAIGNLYIYGQIRGKSITSFDPVSIEEKHADVLSGERDERPYTLPLPFTSDQNFARSYAKYFVATYADPLLQYGAWIFDNKRTVSGNGSTVDLFAVNIGDLIGDSRMENNGWHLVTGVDHFLEPSKATVIVRAARADTTVYAAYDTNVLYDGAARYTI